MMDFVVRVENFAAGSTQIFVLRGDVVASLALFAPEIDVACFLLFRHNSSFPGVFSLPTLTQYHAAIRSISCLKGYHTFTGRQEVLKAPAGLQRKRRQLPKG